MKHRVNRREFFSTATGAALVGMGVPYLSKYAYGSTVAPKFEVQEIKSFSFPHEYYYGWPTLAKRGNELIVVVSGGREGHICPFGRVEMFRSYDNGASWKYPQVLYDGPIDDRDAGICVTDKGTILVTTFTSLAYVGEFEKEAKLRAEGKGRPNVWSDGRFERWRLAHERISAEARQGELGHFMFRSTDDGVTWSARYATPFNSPHGPCQLSNGKLLYAGTELFTDEHRNGCCISEDDGQTWEVKGIIPTREGDTQALYCELHAVEAADGRIVCQIRNHNKNNNNETLQTVSRDGGESWEVPRTLGVWGLPSFLTRLSDDRLVMTYGHRRDPLGIQARISDDNGDTWSEAMIIHGDGTSGDLGYPSTVQLDDGSLFTVWYEVVSGYFAKLRSARWTVS